MLKESDHPVTNGCLTLTTERGANIGPRGMSETHITVSKSPNAMLVVISNTPANRRFLRKALKRMETEVERNAKIEKARR